MNDNTFDAIVVGSGISGGWAAKELTEAGLKTLVLERGREVIHGDFPAAMKERWELPYGGRPNKQDLKDHGVASRTGYAANQDIKHWFVNDAQHPYQQTERFDWVRGYHMGGRSLSGAGRVIA
jgi:choline dehydrogenase-like flavoprotein